MPYAPRPVHFGASGPLSARSARFGMAEFFAAVSLLALNTFVLTLVEWRGALAWPMQTWHFLFAAGLLTLSLFSTRATLIVALGGAGAALLFYAELWAVLAERRRFAEIAWYALFVGWHGAGALAGAYLSVQGRRLTGGLTIGLVSASLLVTLALARSLAHLGPLAYFLPPVEL